MNKRNPNYACASAPDVAARLKHALEANETTRIVLTEGLAALAKALHLHLEQVDEHLKTLIDDLEGRER